MGTLPKHSPFGPGTRTSAGVGSFSPTRLPTLRLQIDLLANAYNE